MGQISPEFWVDDVGKAMDYYERVLGFTRLQVVEREGRISHGLMQIAGSNPLHFTSTARGPGAVEAALEKLAAGGPKGAGVMLLIDLDDRDIDAYYEDLKNKGVKIIEPIQDQFFGARTFRIEDPDGFILTFEKRLPRRDS